MLFVATLVIHPRKISKMLKTNMKYKKEMNLFQENHIKKETDGLNKFREKEW